MSDFVSRGFSGRRRTPEGLGDPLPPGQYAASGFPVLTAGRTPEVGASSGAFGSTGAGFEPHRIRTERFGPTG